MMPHPQHSIKVAREMVDWIFALGQEEDTVQRGNSGTLIVHKPSDAKKANRSLLLLEASYVDSGALPVAPLVLDYTSGASHQQLVAQPVQSHHRK